MSRNEQIKKSATSDEDDSPSQKMITQSLKRVFQEDAEQELPDTLKDFIARLEQSDAESDGEK